MTPSSTESAPGPRTDSTPTPSFSSSLLAAALFPFNSFSRTSNAPRKPIPFTSRPPHSLRDRGTIISQRVVRTALYGGSEEAGTGAVVVAAVAVVAAGWKEVGHRGARGGVEPSSVVGDTT